MILIGCPVYSRDWILPKWFEYIMAQDYPQDDMGFLFIVSSGDKPTIDKLFEFQANNPQIAYFDVIEEDGVSHSDHREVEGNSIYHRNWSSITSLEKMVRLRNIMVSRVREIAPRKFFSLDSDILLINPETISRLDELTDSEADAASPLIYMSDSDLHPGVMGWKPNTDFRGMNLAIRDKSFEVGDKISTDVIMAAKMMSPKAYGVNYIYHRQGEDLGWSWMCKMSGVRLACDTSVYASHILSRKMFEIFNTFGDDRDILNTVKVL